MADPLIIIADADALVALANPADAHHWAAKDINQSLGAKGAHILFPATAIVEALTVLHRKIANPKLTTALLERLTNGALVVEPVTAEVLAAAAPLFVPQASKKHTFFDAVIAAVARQRHAAAIFSFDRWYHAQGLTLASELT